MESISNQKKSLSEILALKLANRINEKLKVNGLDFKKMKYGLEVLIINISKALLIILTANVLGLLKCTLIIMASFAFIRTYAFGVHAKSSINCTAVTASTFFLGGYIAKFLNTFNYEILIMFSVTLVLLYLYAPADTEGRPLVGKEFRKKLKVKSILATVLLMLLALSINNVSLKFCISYGVLCESITTTPFVYKILGRGYKNYENFKRNSN